MSPATGEPDPLSVLTPERRAAFRDMVIPQCRFGPGEPTEATPTFAVAYERARRALADQAEHERSWRALGEWLTELESMLEPLPNLGAPALGVPPKPWPVGAEPVPDTTPPVVDALPDPLADLVAAYRLIADRPWSDLQPDRYMRWVRWSDVSDEPWPGEG